MKLAIVMLLSLAAASSQTSKPPVSPPGGSFDHSAPSGNTDSQDRADHGDDSVASPRPKLVKTYTLPVQGTLRLRNSHYPILDIKSDYPVDLIIGRCSATKVLHFHCEGDPGLILIYDRRKDGSDDVSNVITIIGRLTLESH